MTTSNKPHIRPKVRNNRPSAPSMSPGGDQAAAAAGEGAGAADSDDVDRLLENTRRRIQARLVLSSHKATTTTTTTSEEEHAGKTHEPSAAPPSPAGREPRPMVGILKPSKYVVCDSSKDESLDNKNQTLVVFSESNHEEDSRSKQTRPRAAICSDVKEREPIPQVLQSNNNEPEESSFAVEGHTPRTDDVVTGYPPNKDDGPLVISSISELMEKANALPSRQHKGGSLSVDGRHQVVEADLSFACMTPEEYEETVKEAESMTASMTESNLVDEETRNAAGAAAPIESYDTTTIGNNHKHVLLGHDGMLLHDDHDYDDDSDNENDDPLLGGRSTANDSDEELSPPSLVPPPRAFILLWDVITDWATPETILLLKQWRDSPSSDDAGSSSPAMLDHPMSTTSPQVDQTDVGSSRRKGLQAMLTMYLASSMEEVGLAQGDRRMVESRLVNLLRTMRFSHPMAKFDSSMWKAMTCLLVQMVVIDSSTVDDRIPTMDLPGPIKAVDMKREEYEYLTRSAILNLEAQST